MRSRRRQLPPPAGFVNERPFEGNLPRPRPDIEQQYRDSQPFSVQPWSLDDYLKREGYTDETPQVASADPNFVPPLNSWKSPAETLQEWKEQRARERRSYDPLSAGPPSPFNMVRPEGEPGGLPAQQTRYDPLSAAGPGNPLQAALSPNYRIGGGIAPGALAQTQQPAASVSSPFDPPAGFPTRFTPPAASGPANPFAGISVSDRVRGNRYANMDPRERQALNLTIAGELSPYSYGKPVTDQEVANMVETVTTRAAKTGDSIEDTVRDPWQYSPWNTLPDQARMRENLEAHGPDVRRMVSNAVTGDVMPTHEGLTHYLNRDAVRRIPDWATADKRAAKVGPHTFYRDVDPYDTAQSLLPPSPAGAITSRDLPTPPPLTSMVAGRPASPLGPGSLPADCWSGRANPARIA